MEHLQDFHLWFSCTLYLYVLTHLAVGRQLRALISSINIHTSSSINLPEFTLTCHIEGGPATIVTWSRNGVRVDEDGDNEASKVIVNTFPYNIVYESRLHVRGVDGGRYQCRVTTWGAGSWTSTGSYEFNIQGSCRCISCMYDCTQVYASILSMYIHMFFPVFLFFLILYPTIPLECHAMCHLHGLCNNYLLCLATPQ